MSHLWPEVVPSACLGHSQAREGKEMKNGRRRVSEVEEKKWDGFEMKMKGEGGGGGGLNRWV